MKSTRGPKQATLDLIQEIILKLDHTASVTFNIGASETHINVEAANTSRRKGLYGNHIRRADDVKTGVREVGMKEILRGFSAVDQHSYKLYIEY